MCLIYEKKHFVIQDFFVVYQKQYFEIKPYQWHWDAFQPKF